ncbi:hypothetical protein EN797_040970, partial [Mesorhizobium sp. M2E.F.Ca.ET.154.01.1.1]
MNGSRHACCRSYTSCSGATGEASESARVLPEAGLNKGEAAHKLKRAVFFHERGEIRDRSYDSQAFR